MSWPLSQDYNEAIQSPRSNFADPDLQRGEAVCNALGLPMPYSGNFADVYQVRCPDGGRWAVKCFTREAVSLHERYLQISAHLRQAKLPFMVDFSYLDRGIRVAGKWYAVLKMEWVEGLTLNQFVAQYLDRPAMLEALAQVWAKMAKYLRSAEVGHCDLQHGNVLLAPGADSHSLKLKLIDYDGMWVPALAKDQSGEVGHPSYQHPQRLREQSYNIDVDRFPLLLIATALQALKARGKELWDKYDNGDNLLFKEPDLREPLKSYLFLDLTKTDDAAMKPLVDHLIKALRGGLETTPLLEELMPEAQKASTPAPPTRRSKLGGGPPSGTGLNKSGTKTAPVAPATTSSRLAPTAAPGAPPAAPVAPVAAGGLDFDEPAPGLVKRAKGRRTTRRSPGAPKRGRIGAVVAAVVVFGLAGGLAVWVMRGSRKDTKQEMPVTPIVPKDAGTLPSRDPERENPPPDKPAELTREAFDKIDKDMTKDDVVKLLGPSVNEGDPFVLGSLKIITLSWQNADNRVEVVLTQDKVTNKGNNQGWPLVWPGDVAKNPSPPDKPAELTRQVFDKIDKDMTKDDVVKLLGPSFNEGKPLVLGTSKIITLSWQNADNRVDVTLTQDKVTNKVNNRGWPFRWPSEVAKNPPPRPPQQGESSPPGEKSRERLAVPDDAALADAEKKVKEVYKEEFAKRKPEEVKALASKLLADGLDSKDDPAAQFVLLRESRDVSAGAGDMGSALRAAESLGDRFKVDAAEMRTRALEEASGASVPAEARANVAALALAYAQDAVDADDYATADRLAKAAQSAAFSIPNKSLETVVQHRASAIQDLRTAYASVQDAVKTLATKADDPDANLALGKFFCLDKGDWCRGLPMLALGSDAKLKELAEKDAAAPAEAVMQEEVGGSYAAWAKEESGARKRNLLRRASYWYEQAEEGLTGLPHTDVVKQIAEIDKTAAAAPAAVLFAAYGYDDAWTDVTINVRSLLSAAKDQKLALETGARELGVTGPPASQQRSLIVVYRYKEQVCLSITGNGEKAAIPSADAKPMNPAAPGQALTILYARYGAEDRWADATAKAQELVKGSTLAVKPDDLDFDVGGAAGVRKALVIVCRKGGRVRLSITGDSQVAVVSGDESRFATLAPDGNGPLAGFPDLSPQPGKHKLTRADLVGVWLHGVVGGKPGEITLLPSGKIKNAEATWAFKGMKLTLRWLNAKAPGGAWVDECTVSEDGATYKGANQNGTPISGTKVSDQSPPKTP